MVPGRSVMLDATMAILGWIGLGWPWYSSWFRWWWQREQQSIKQLLAHKVLGKMQKVRNRSCAKALVDMHRATGGTLKENGIELRDALTGEITRHPSPPFQAYQRSNAESK